MISWVCRCIPLLPLAIALVSCSDNCMNVTMAGKLRSEYRASAPLHGIELQSSARVYVSIADTTTLKVEADENVVDLMTTDFRDGRLIIGTTPGFCTDAGVAMTVWIQTPSLDRIDLSGSGSVVVSGQVVEDVVAIHVSGSGSIDLDASVKTRLASTISGSGTISLRGTAGLHDIDISGSGALASFDMVSRRASVKLSGSGIARLTVQGELNVDLSGSGVVQYRGEPTILNVSVTGSGSVEKLK